MNDQLLVFGPQLFYRDSADRFFRESPFVYYSEGYRGAPWFNVSFALAVRLIPLLVLRI